MSGHNNFTSWIDTKAGSLVLKDGTKKEVKETHFTSDPVPNSDNLFIRFSDGTFASADSEKRNNNLWDSIDWEEAKERFSLQEHL